MKLFKWYQEKGWKQKVRKECVFAHSLLFLLSGLDKWKNECVKKNASRLIISYKSGNMLRSVRYKVETSCSSGWTGDDGAPRGHRYPTNPY